MARSEGRLLQPPSIARTPNTATTYTTNKTLTLTIPPTPKKQLPSRIRCQRRELMSLDCYLNQLASGGWHRVRMSGDMLVRYKQLQYWVRYCTLYYRVLPVISGRSFILENLYLSPLQKSIRHRPRYAGNWKFFRLNTLLREKFIDSVAYPYPEHLARDACGLDVTSIKAEITTFFLFCCASQDLQGFTALRLFFFHEHIARESEMTWC